MLRLLQVLVDLLLLGGMGWLYYVKYKDSLSSFKVDNLHEVVDVDEGGLEGEVLHPIDLPDTSPYIEGVEEREWRIEQQTLKDKERESASYYQ